jgi:hypothetical protein
MHPTGYFIGGFCLSPLKPFHRPNASDLIYSIIFTLSVGARAANIFNLPDLSTLRKLLSIQTFVTFEMIQ